MKNDKLQALCDLYDIKCRRIERLTTELEELKHESRDLYAQIEKEL